MQPTIYRLLVQTQPWPRVDNQYEFTHRKIGTWHMDKDGMMVVYTVEVLMPIMPAMGVMLLREE